MLWFGRGLPCKSVCNPQCPTCPPRPQLCCFSLLALRDSCVITFWQHDGQGVRRLSTFSQRELVHRIQNHGQLPTDTYSLMWHRNKSNVHLGLTLCRTGHSMANLKQVVVCGCHGACLSSRGEGVTGIQAPGHSHPGLHQSVSPGLVSSTAPAHSARVTDHRDPRWTEAESGKRYWLGE